MLYFQIENLYNLWAFLIYHQPKEAHFREHLAKVGTTTCFFEFYFRLIFLKSCMINLLMYGYKTVRRP